MTLIKDNLSSGFSYIIPIFICLGVFIGIGSFTFYYARGYSYITDDPNACANCHVMKEFLDSWQKSSHHNVAVCNDCHTGHTLFSKYYVKGLNGYHHSVAFTLGNFHEPIRIKEFNRKVAEGNCRYCHQDIVQNIDANIAHREPLQCLTCHFNVGHFNY